MHILQNSFDHRLCFLHLMNEILFHHNLGKEMIINPLPNLVVLQNYRWNAIENDTHIGNLYGLIMRTRNGAYKKPILIVWGTKENLLKRFHVFLLLKYFVRFVPCCVRVCAVLICTCALLVVWGLHIIVGCSFWL